MGYFLHLGITHGVLIHDLLEPRGEGEREVMLPTVGEREGGGSKCHHGVSVDLCIGNGVW